MNDKVAKDASSRNAQVVIAYGFDKIGFETPNEDIALSEYASIRFVNYGGSAVSVSSSDSTSTGASADTSSMGSATTR